MLILTVDRGEPVEEAVRRASVLANFRQEPVNIMCIKWSVIVALPGESVLELIHRYQDEFPECSPFRILDRRFSHFDEVLPQQRVA